MSAPVLARLHHRPSPLAEAELGQHTHVVVLLPAAKRLEALSKVPCSALIQAALKRRKMKPEALAKTPISVQMPSGGLLVVAMRDPGKTVFERHTLLRKAIGLLLEEAPSRLALSVPGSDATDAAAELLYCTWLNAFTLPQRKGRKVAKNTKTGEADVDDNAKKAAGVQRIDLFAEADKGRLQAIQAVAEGNCLCRELTALPPNELTPGAYRTQIKSLARANGWEHHEWDLKQLSKMGAGAFVAVAQGSSAQDAAIIRLRYRPIKSAGTVRHVALIGKGICFDTGGHNLKPARYMSGMHEDMNGSAVVLGMLQALTKMKAPIAVDCWLAVASNHLSPEAYVQNSVITSLQGTTIEVVHTDAEGRLVLADTLQLASREAPELMIDFATLTGTMVTALGGRMSGVFATSDALAQYAQQAGRDSGERVVVLPMEEDYDQALDSKIADVKQCLLDGDADHIYAARFLRRFTSKLPWLHVDLSAVNCSGGLGAVNGDLTGFGVAWGVAMLQHWVLQTKSVPKS